MLLILVLVLIINLLPMPATDTISPIPEVMPGDNNGNIPPTFM